MESVLCRAVLLRTFVISDVSYDLPRSIDYSSSRMRRICFDVQIRLCSLEPEPFLQFFDFMLLSTSFPIGRLCMFEQRLCDILRANGQHVYQPSIFKPLKHAP